MRPRPLCRLHALVCQGAASRSKPALSLLALILLVVGPSACLRRPPPTTLSPGKQATGTPEGEAPRPGSDRKGEVRVQVSVGAGHSCALVANSELYCWGDNRYGQLGDGSQRSRQAAGPVRGSSALVAVSSGKGHTCAIDRRAQLWCWGDNRFGQLGLGPVSLRRSFVPTPTRVGGISGQVRSVFSGEHHTCAITRDNVLYCWGDNARGQLGQAAPTVFPQPVRVQGVGRVKQIALGRAHSCVLRSDQVVLCWGDNGQGQLGTQLPASRHRPARVNGLAKSTVIGAGGDRSCAASGSGVHCWGRGTGGGAGFAVKRAVGVRDVASLSVGETSACLVDKQNRPMCWGRNDEGQLGDGTNRDSADPRPLAGLRKALALSVGPRHSCAVGVRGKIYCWGSDGFAALGSPANQAPLSSQELRRTLMLSPSRGIAAGRAFACALGDSGTVFCWGDNSKGQLGTGVVAAYSAMPQRVKGIDDAVSVVAGDEHACALRKNGMLKCWGSNVDRQLGVGRFHNQISREPLTVTQVRDVVHVAAGKSFSCAVSRQGQVWCWGASSRGQLGHASGGTAPVSGLQGVLRVYAGAEHACAKTRGGQLFCWGDNSKGQLGSNGGARALNDPVPRPVAVRGISGVGEVALGERFSCAVAAGGKVYCWGDNHHGQIGNGTASDVWMMPVPVASLRGASALGAGHQHVCADHGSWVYCWGKVPPGGSVGAQSIEVRKPVRSVSMQARQLAAGERFSCAVDPDGQVACWGEEHSGELGRGIRGFSNRAVPVTGL